MQKQLLSDFLFVDGRSFQHSIIVILKVFQGSAQSYKTQQKSRSLLIQKKGTENQITAKWYCMWDYELLFNWPYTHEVACPGALLTRIGSLHFYLKYTKLLGVKTMNKQKKMCLQMAVSWTSYLVKPAILSSSVNLHQGRSRGGVLGCPWRPLLQAFFNQTTCKNAMTISWP